MSDDGEQKIVLYNKLFCAFELLEPINSDPAENHQHINKLISGVNRNNIKKKNCILAMIW